MKFWLLALACWGFAGSARAEPTLDPDHRTREQPWLVRLAPTADELRDERARRLEQRLERALSVLPDVATATVQLTLPLAAEAALDQPAATPGAVVMLRTGPRGPDDGELTQIVATALAHPGPRLSIVRRPASAPKPTGLVDVGPFRVAASSAGALRVGLAVMLITNALLALLLLARVRRPSTPGTES